MHPSTVLKVLLRRRDGQVEWKEITENQLPKGGKKLSFRQNSLIGFGFAMCLFTYAYFQSEINPDSKWAKVYRTITTEPFSWLANGKDHIPISSDHMSPIK